MPKDNPEKTESAPKSNLPKILLLIALITIPVSAILFYGESNKNTCQTNPELKTTRITSGGKEVTAEVVSESADKIQGLSGRDCLDEGRGMLFSYELAGDYCLWMKDMKFAIDMVWLDDDKQVVTVKQNATPESFPDKFCPDKPAKYMLELGSGETARLGWDVGTAVEF